MTQTIVQNLADRQHQQQRRLQQRWAGSLAGQCSSLLEMMTCVSTNIIIISSCSSSSNTTERFEE